MVMLSDFQRAIAVNASRPTLPLEIDFRSTTHQLITPRAGTKVELVTLTHLILLQEVPLIMEVAIIAIYPT